MKIKAKKEFQSAVVHMFAGEERELELDAYTLQNWVENGLIEDVKKPVNTDENK